MAVTPSDILEIARQLLGTEEVAPSEASMRSAASRAYYSAFHAANSSLPEELQPDSSLRNGPSSHQIIIDAYVAWGRAHRPGRTDAIIVSRNLARLKLLRKQADYNIDDAFSLSDSKLSCKVAGTTIESAVRAMEANSRKDVG